MRLSLLLLMGALLGVKTTATGAQHLAQTQTQAAVTSATLDESEVRITYGELKRLVAATLPQAVPQEPKVMPPVAAALMASVYRLDAGKGTLVAELQVENFDGGWHAIPLAGARAGAMSVQPPEARVVVFEDQLCLITDKAGAVSLKLTFPLSPPGQETTIALAAAALTALELSGLEEGKVLRVTHGGSVSSLTNNGTTTLPAGGGEVTFLIEEAKPAAAQVAGGAGAVADDALVTKASYATEVVRDGSVFTEGTITVRHDVPVRLALQFPADAKLLQCRVNGSAVRPVLKAGGGLEIALDDPATDGAESEVKLSFTSAFPALQPAEGEIVLALPQIPLFARQIDWTVQMPAGFDLSVTGNVEQITETAAIPPASPGLHLRKSLCRNQQPEARITYRKR
jgi:hypothetical protein